MNSKMPRITPAVPIKFRRAAVKNERQSVELAKELILDMARAVQVSDFSDIDLLDVGCGVRYTQAFLTFDLPIKTYTGIDTYHEMLEFLRENIKDPRFRYVSFEAHNELYAANQEKATIDSRFDVGDSQFDVICAQSLFTHLDPEGFQVMLHVIRKAIKRNGWLVFSLFLNEPSSTGFGYVDAWIKKLTPEQAKAIESTPSKEKPKFIDAVPNEPLLVAVFRRDYAIEMAEKAGWEVVEIRDPQPFVQHQFVCRPV